MTAPRRRFLLTTWEGGGAVTPEMGVARALVARGHEVHVLADPTLRATALAVGCDFSPWRRAPHRTSLRVSEDLIKDWEVSNPLAGLARMRDRMIAGPAADVAADTAEVIDRISPDAVAPDYLHFGSIIAAQSAGLPVAPVVPNIWTVPARGVPAIGPGFQLPTNALGRARDAALLTLVNRAFAKGLPALNSARRAAGLEPIGSLYDQVLGAERILVLSSAAFDFSAPFVPANVRYVGAVLDEPEWASPWQPAWPADSTDPLVLVGFSSTYQAQGPLLQRIVDALSALPVRAVVTLGMMLDEDAVAGSANVEVVRSAPHVRILQDAALVVTHCGHGTTMKSLAAGVPLVCVPMGRDQNDTAARVVAAGAGVRLSPKASVEKIRAAVETTLRDKRFRRNAEGLAARIGAESGAAGAAAELESLVGPSASGDSRRAEAPPTGPPAGGRQADDGRSPATGR